jgi:hypothetical protein
MGGTMDAKQCDCTNATNCTLKMLKMKFSRLQWCLPETPVRSVKWEDPEFEACLGNLVGPSLKNK